MSQINGPGNNSTTFFLFVLKAECLVLVKYEENANSPIDISVAKNITSTVHTQCLNPNWESFASGIEASHQRVSTGEQTPSLPDMFVFTDFSSIPLIVATEAQSYSCGLAQCPRRTQRRQGTLQYITVNCANIPLKSRCPVCLRS